MPKPDIALWKSRDNDWSVEINDMLYEHVPLTAAYDLVEFALIANDQEMCAEQLPPANRVSWTSVRLIADSHSETRPISRITTKSVN
jgi:hypothetical protein